MARQLEELKGQANAPTGELGVEPMAHRHIGLTRPANKRANTVSGQVGKRASIIDGVGCCFSAMLESESRGETALKQWICMHATSA